VELAREAAGAGVHLFQIREKDLSTRDLETLVRDVLSAAAGSAMRILVNDRLDVAMAAGANGVHLPATSPASARIRSLAPPGFVIGRSVHSAEEASIESASGAADYLIIGTVFPSSSKAEPHRSIGIDEVARASRSSRLPILAIGGIDVAKLTEVRKAGAAGFAAITFFAGRGGRETMRWAVEQAQRAFDTSRSDV
jgi:thiamine-phosphate pyrophosphorylase